MEKRGDPLVPLLASAVAAVVVGAVLFVFFPRLERWLQRRSGDALLAPVPARDTPVGVWVSSSADGAALLLEYFSDPASEAEVHGALRGGAPHLLLLTACNVSGPEPLVVDLTSSGVAGPGGATVAVAAANLLRHDVAPALLPVLKALGAVARLEVPRGRSGQMLLAAYEDPRPLPELSAGALRFERREVTRVALATWRSRPDLRALGGSG